jgi:hypothetical protein
VARDELERAAHDVAELQRIRGSALVMAGALLSLAGSMLTAGHLAIALAMIVCGLGLLAVYAYLAPETYYFKLHKR